MYRDFSKGSAVSGMLGPKRSDKRGFGSASTALDLVRLTLVAGGGLVVGGILSGGLLVR
jgi:hypothetical protein